MSTNYILKWGLIIAMIIVGVAYIFNHISPWGAIITTIIAIVLIINKLNKKKNEEL